MIKKYPDHLRLTEVLSRSEMSFNMERLEETLRVKIDLDKLLTELATYGSVLMENKIDSIEVYVGDQVFKGREEYEIAQKRTSKGYKHVTS